MIKIDYRRIALKAQQLVKKRIVELGLVSTGTMRDSIKGIPAKDGIKIIGVDYFNDQDEKHGITKFVFEESSEFDDFMEQDIKKQIEKGIDKEFKNIK